MDNYSFFDPYSYINGNNIPKNNFNAPKADSEDITSTLNLLSPKEFYDTQFSYYRYLNEVLRNRQLQEEIKKKEE